MASVILKIIIPSNINTGISQPIHFLDEYKIKSINASEYTDCDDNWIWIGTVSTNHFTNIFMSKLYEITIDSTSKYNGWNISLHFQKIKN